ncbi:MAG: hotdog domain-containing protein [Chloroflexota bacterium]|nr:hotdog domain-containing protein [Chloroflexota bacterium]
MPLSDLHPGDSAVGAVVVQTEHLASTITPGAPEAFSTPALVALVERTAADWLKGHLGPGQMTVGTSMVVYHTAPTPRGMEVRAEVTITAIDDRRIEFEWVAHDEREKVGHGTHQRAVVDAARFGARLVEKTR